MSDLTITHAGSTVTQTRQEVLSNNKKLNQMKVDLIDVVPTCDTDAIPNDDVIFDWVEIPNAVAVKGGSAIIQSIHLLDKAIKSATMDIFFQTDNTTLGTLGGDPSLGDADATDMLVFVGGVYQIPTTNYTYSGGEITFGSPVPTNDGVSNGHIVTVIHNVHKLGE